MGSQENEAERYVDEKQHQVGPNSFFMGKYEVTQTEYQEVMGTTPSTCFIEDGLPVEHLSWHAALEFRSALSRTDNFAPTYSLDCESVTWDQREENCRLSTEVKWEYACRAGHTHLSA